ncbi:MAG: Uncharacterised protein [Marinobacterium sp. xm-d-530]|nr:MAG: Uncharacterised protein [Marinobacterium sp. xm-d-530]
MEEVILFAVTVTFNGSTVSSETAKEEAVDAASKRVVNNFMISLNAPTAHGWMELRVGRYPGLEVSISTPSQLSPVA